MAAARLTKLAVLVAGIGVAAASVLPAAAQNYDGGMQLRVGAFAQGTFLNFGVKQPVTGSAASDGIAFGGSAGIDYLPSPHWLMGIEFDAALGDARGTFNSTSYGLDYFASLRGRFGVFARPDLLLYGTAGLGFLGFEAQRPGVGNKALETITGALVGLGVEYNWHHVILFSEYNYANFGARQFTISNTRHETDAEAHLLRLGIKFKVGHDHEHGWGRHYDPLK